MVIKNQNQKLYFSGDKDPIDIISEILEKNNLKETIQDAINKPKQGKISRIEKFDPETRTVTVVVTPTKFIGKSTNRLPLVAGMYCQVSFTGKELKNVVKIPWSALQLNGHVYVVDKNNVVHEKEVNIKSSRQDQVIISSGLDAGEKIINQRIPYGVVNGSKVKTVIVNNK